MIEEAFVSFDTAKLLREKGFDEVCHLIRLINGTIEVNVNNLKNSDSDCFVDNNDFDDYTVFISIPTHQMAMTWLREKYDIDISVYPTIQTDMIVKESYAYTIYKNRQSMHSSCSKTYEEAVEAAIKYVLENLI